VAKALEGANLRARILTSHGVATGAECAIPKGMFADPLPDPETSGPFKWRRAESLFCGTHQRSRARAELLRLDQRAPAQSELKARIKHVFDPTSVDGFFAVRPLRVLCQAFVHQQAPTLDKDRVDPPRDRIERRDHDLRLAAPLRRIVGTVEGLPSSMAPTRRLGNRPSAQSGT
jgi:hypothetical protein